MKKFTDGKKEILLQTQGLSLISKTLQNGKERLSSKEFANHDALQKAFVKKQVDALKKGLHLRKQRSKIRRGNSACLYRWRIQRSAWICRV